MHMIIQGALVAAAWRWGDWRHWQRYYSTILFLMIGELFNEFINYNHPLWTYVPNAIEKSFYPNHTIITLGQLLFGFPSLVLLYLGRYPEGKTKPVLYVAGWVALQSVVEAISHYVAGGISYSNGWNLGYSVLFNILFFSIIRIHYLYPLWAWAISVGIIVVRILFLLPLHGMK